MPHTARFSTGCYPARATGLTAALLLLAVCIATANAAPPAPWEVEGLRDRPAPGFSLPTLPEAGAKSLADYRGSVVLINFWATWCGPCRREMPALNRLADRYRKQGLSVLGIALDDDPAVVRAFIRRLGVRFTILHDPGQQVASRYKVFAYPTSFLLDRQGIVRAVYLGEQAWDGQAVGAAIEKLLNAESTPAQRPEK